MSDFIRKECILLLCATPETDNIDEFVGAKIRQARKIHGMTQDQLAKQLGTTFQQIQKYERGLNRINAGKLWQLSKSFNVSVNFFFEGYEKPLIPEQEILTLHDHPETTHPPLLDNDTLDLLHYFSRIKNRKLAKSVVDLAKTLAAAEAAQDDTNDTPKSCD